MEKTTSPAGTNPTVSGTNIPAQQTPGTVQRSTLQPEEKKVVHKLPASGSTKMRSIIVGVVVVLAGIGTGYLFSGASANGGEPAPTSNIAEDSQAPKVDESTLSEPEVGVLHEGGIDGEGTHYLDRGTGEEKYIYLLSTVLNLDSFVGRKVEIRGHTLGAEKAGWLMDVVKIKEAN